MVRKIIKINEALCNGCGLCAKACHEGAIEMVNGKAKLVHEHYCDGLGDCLPSCPVDAISFEEREAPAYDEAAVKAAQKEKRIPPQQHAFDDTLACGCPGSMAKQIRKEPQGACSHTPTMSPSGRCSSFDSRRLYCLRLRQFSSGFYPGTHHSYWMPKTG